MHAGVRSCHKDEIVELQLIAADNPKRQQVEGGRIQQNYNFKDKISRFLRFILLYVRKLREPAVRKQCIGPRDDHVTLKTSLPNALLFSSEINTVN